MTKKALLTLSIALLLCSCVEKEPLEPTPTPPSPIVEQDYIKDSTILASIWHKRFSEEESGFCSANDLVKARWIVDGNPVNTYRTSYKNAQRDLRYEFYSQDAMRFVSEADGYAITIPNELNLKPSYELAKYGQLLSNEDISLRITLEKVDPYPPTEEYFNVYTGEWLDRYISNSNFISQNGLSYLESTIKNDTGIIEGYSINVYSIKATGLDKPYYKIAIVRPTNQWSKFGFIVYKCKESSDYKQFDRLLKSFRVINSYGTSKNFLPAQVAKANPKWNAETAKYYKKLIDQKTFDFGVFSYSMPSDDDASLETQRAKIKAETDRLVSVFGRPFDIMPTYTHIAWYTTKTGFPNILAKEFAGGNGFNSKPVLQFTYQFTTNNNNVNPWNSTQCQTPMFDILRGKYEEDFTKLAKDIKAYAKPVLFRLNNEMNTDWTSYCGMMTLCDPEIFIQTWRYLYGLFEKEGVDNCIWIFNPIAQSCPYSKWGENLAYYPGNDYVQALGVTNYEMGNTLPLQSFRDRYTIVYNTNKELFSQMPWIISEFACGSGGATTGEEMRHGHEQSLWVKAMFQDFIDYDSNSYLKPLKGGVWFNCNDYSEDQTLNFLRLDPALTETLDAFTWGFQEMYK